MPWFNADFNQDGNSVFENVYIYGDLIYDFENLRVKDLTVDGYSLQTGIATFKDDVFIEGTLNLDKLTISQEFEVGVGGTLFTAKTTTNGANVGVSNQSPTEKFHVNSGDSSFVITGFGTVGVGTVAPAGDWIKNNALFNEGSQGKLKLDVSETIRIGRNIYDSVGSPGENDFWLKRYATAIIKKQWGMNLIKFNGVLLPGGVQLNGRQIYEDAIRELEELEETLRTEYEIPPLDLIG